MTLQQIISTFWRTSLQELWCLTVTQQTQGPQSVTSDKVFLGGHVVLSWQPFISSHWHEAWIRGQSECCAAGALLNDSAISQQGYKACFVYHRCLPAKKMHGWPCLHVYACMLICVCRHTQTKPPTYILLELLFKYRVTDKVMTLLSGQGGIH